MGELVGLGIDGAGGRAFGRLFRCVGEKWGGGGKFGRPSGTETVAGSRSQGSRPLKRTSPWAILGRSSGARRGSAWKRDAS